MLTVHGVLQVQQRMQRLKEKLFRDISNVLEPSRQHPPGRWQEAWYRAGRFLNRRPGRSEAHQLELQTKLYELHAAISSSIEAEVCLLALVPLAVTGLRRVEPA